jgi:hypothetical protein
VGSGGRHIIGRHIRVEREVKLGARLSEGIWWVWLAHSYDAGCCVALVLPPAALSALQMRGRRAVLWLAGRLADGDSHNPFFPMRVLRWLGCNGTRVWAPYYGAFTQAWTKPGKEITP